jgi:hypothetical protein
VNAGVDLVCRSNIEILATIVRCVADDPEQPRTEQIAVATVIHPLPRSHERVLTCVFRLGRFAELGESNQVCSASVAPEQNLERSRVAESGPRNKRPIGVDQKRVRMNVATVVADGGS